MSKARITLKNRHEEMELLAGDRSKWWAARFFDEGDEIPDECVFFTEYSLTDLDIERASRIATESVVDR